jgi:DNA-binding XRE family transcriptional regulator
MCFQEDVKMFQDVRDYDAVKAALERGEEELVPGKVVFAILDGDNPIKVWRTYRGLTQAALAQKAEISVPYLSQIETGKRVGTTEVLKAIAKALKLTLDDIVIPTDS